MYVRVVAVLSLIGVLFLSACSSSVGSSPLSSTASSSTGSALSDQSAAPMPLAATSRPTSQNDQSYSLFLDWMAFESMEIQPLTRTDKAYYNAGLSACRLIGNRGLTPAMVVDTLKKNGYGGTEAAAVVRSSLAALCPQNDYYGYQTAFDSDVVRFRSAMNDQIMFSVEPNVYDLGVFMAATCLAMGNPQIDGSGIFQFVTSHAKHGDLELVAGVTDRVVVYKMINLAVTSHCSALYTHLPPVVQTSVR